LHNSGNASLTQQEIDTVWTAIALHTTPDIPPHMHPVIALVTAGVEMDVLGIAYSEFSDAEREAVVQAPFADASDSRCAVTFSRDAFHATPLVGRSIGALGRNR
jgi:hypothetical protein